MVKIIFEAHSTTIDNENHIASGNRDVALSPAGVIQSEELGLRYKAAHFDAIFCSDLRRSYGTAELAFGVKFPVIRDRRLREVDYGHFEGENSEVVHLQKPRHVVEPFPKGESYEQSTARVKEFLKELLEKYDGKEIMIIGHRATQYALEHLVKGVPLYDAVSAPWKWQPGWTYELKNLPA